MAVKEIDCVCEACPVPIIKAINELKSMDKGDILIVHTDHSCVGISMQEWAEKNDHAVEIVEIENGQWEVYIEKEKDK